MELKQAQSVFKNHVWDLQDRICQALRELDPDLEIQEDIWTRKDHAGDEGGGGRTRAITGSVIENAGVNVSEVYGALDPKFAQHLGGKPTDKLWASGVSLILHPHNPRVPTVHANFRMISVGDRWWFGGGADLTPFYPTVEEFQSFHDHWKAKCAPYGTWQEWKDWCDRYFVNHHRQGEMRGVGGIFYDKICSGDLAGDLAMQMDLSEGFIPSWFPMAHRHKTDVFTDADREFQEYRRGRYVEFNLLHDRGTHFGLKTNGRTESILISLPAKVRFGYRYAPPEGSVHADMMQYYWPRDW